MSGWLMSRSTTNDTWCSSGTCLPSMKMLTFTAPACPMLMAGTSHALGHRDALGFLELERHGGAKRRSVRRKHRVLGRHVLDHALELVIVTRDDRAPHDHAVMRAALLVVIGAGFADRRHRLERLDLVVDALARLVAI